jgi:stringent starvation protein B
MAFTLEAPSTRPYLIRALYEWCTDNGFTPYIAAYVDESVQVPREYVKNDEIVLNISMDATSSLKLGNEFIEFKARFAGKAREIMVPIERVIAIYARENGQGMAFPTPVPGAAASNSPGELALARVRPPQAEQPTAPKVVPLSSVAKPDGASPNDPKPPSGPRPALTRVK